MSNWVLKLSNKTDIAVDEKGNIVSIDEGRFSMMDEDKAVDEARRRAKKIRYFLCGDHKRVITFNA